MLCRLYDTRKKTYIPVDETMDYLVHPVGAVIAEGAEDHRIEVELSSQRLDINGHEIYANDRVEAEVRGTGEVVKGVVVFYHTAGMFAIKTEDGVAINSHGRTRTWTSYKNIKVVGTTHDEEMEAE